MEQKARGKMEFIESDVVLPDMRPLFLAGNSVCHPSRPISQLRARTVSPGSGEQKSNFHIKFLLFPQPFIVFSAQLRKMSKAEQVLILEPLTELRFRGKNLY